MKSWVLAASLLAAAFVPAASAADIGDDRHGGYIDRYRVPPPAIDRYRPPPPAYRDHDDDDDGPPPVRRYSGQPTPTCARSEEVRERLTDRGWRDFHDGQPQGDVVTLRARRPNGRLFELTLHRCTGEIIEARPLEPRPFGPFAFNRRPRDFDDDAPGSGDRWEHDSYANRSPRWWHRGY
jgi:hypothetical protein